jgi:hypothetical protein
MTDLRTAAAAALEALTESVDLVQHAYDSDWRHGMPTRAAQLAAMKDGLDAHHAAIEALRAALDAPQGEPASGWLEAAVAWEVCASIHETWAKGKDALYKTRHADFVKHADDARQKHAAAPPQVQPLDYFRVQEIAQARRIGYNELSAALRDYLGIGQQESNP